MSLLQTISFLTPVAFAQAVAVPLIAAGALIALRRRTTDRWLPPTAFLSGMAGAYTLNNALLRLLPPVLASGTVPATVREAWLSAFVEGALPEEITKGACCLAFLLTWRRVDTRALPLIGAFVGLGFALHENLDYAVTTPGMRVTASHSHGTLGLILGSLLQRARGKADWRPPARLLAFLSAFGVPILLHGLWNVAVGLTDVYESPARPNPAGTPTGAQVGAMLLWAAVFITETAWGVRILRRLRRNSEERCGKQSAS